MRFKVSIILFTDVVVDIKIDPDVVPVAQRYRKIPIHLEEEVDKQLDDLLRRDIVEMVNTPSRWVSPLTLAMKNDGSFRLCVDMREANKAIIRERHPLPTFDDICPLLAGSTIFSTFDVKSAFYQLEISEESRYITTFITKRGLMRFKRLIFGICNAPELFQKIFEQILAGLDGVINFMDDGIVFGKNQEDHDRKLKAALKRLKDFNVELNEEKCKFGKTELVFMGHVISKDGIRPCESSIDTLNRFRLPATKEELDSFLGFVQYHGRFIRDLASMMDSLREMTKGVKSKKSALVWNMKNKKIFQDIKDGLKSDRVLGFFNKSDSTIVEVDASPVGLGAILSQKSAHNVERVIMFASKTLTDVEKRYSQTEKEALAIVWAVERFQYFLLGCEFTLLTDHKPLLFMFDPRAKPCARIDRWILRLQAFRFKLQHKPGKKNWADALSRTAATDLNPVAFDEDAEHFVMSIIDENAVKAVTLSEIRAANIADKQFKEIENALLSGNWNGPWRQWKSISGEFSIDNNILARADRVYVPEILRDRVVKVAHEGHLGRTKMIMNLRSNVWWPSMTKDVELELRQCKACLMVSKPDRPIPLKMRELPRGPGQDLAFDFQDAGKYGKEVLVGIDYYSRFAHFAIQKSTGADETIRNMQLIFARFSWPKSITADNGPPFNSKEFKRFCDTYGIILFFSPPRFAQVNGMVERMNENVKKTITISWNSNSKDWQYDLLVTYLSSYHSSVHSVTGKTPFELMFGRKMKTKIPSLENDMRGIDDEVREKDAMEKQKIKERADEHRHAVESEIEAGDTVLLKNDRKEHKLVPNFGKDEFVVVTRKGGDCIIQSESGVEKRRHISHLKKVYKVPQVMLPSQIQPSTSGSSQQSTFQNPAIAPVTSSPKLPAILQDESSPLMEQQQEDLAISLRSPRPKRSCVEPTKYKDYVRRVSKD